MAGTKKFQLYDATGLQRQVDLNTSNHVAIFDADDNEVMDTEAHASRHAQGGADEVVGIVLQGTEAEKPAAGTAGRFWLSTDTLALYYDDGTSWVQVGVLGGLDLTAHASRHAAGGADEITGIAYTQLAVDTISFTVYVPIPDSPQSGLAADSTGVKWTTAFRHEWHKRHLKKVRIRATWSATQADSVTKIAVRDVSSGNDVVSVSGNAATDEEAEQTDLTNVTDGGLFEVYAEVTTASATGGATFDISYVVVELVYGIS